MAANLFNEQWYLQNNPDVAEAVQLGLVSAAEHFALFGKYEGRAPGPLFDPNHYLSHNPDVGAAVQAGLITAYDHFAQFGTQESRSPVPYFDVAFYLQQNPDIAAAVEQGLISATEHFLLFGQAEPRAISPFFDMGAYLAANPDIGEAVAAGLISPLDHLLTFGVTEGRDLGNGVSLAQFQNDSVFQNALSGGGNLFDALNRIAEVAPFLPTFQSPANWVPPPDTPIPVDFVPPEGTVLVIPPSVVVPPDTQLPDTFVPPQPTAPDDDDTSGGGEEPQGDPVVGPGGGGGAVITTDPQEFILTTGNDTYTGGRGDDTFIAAGTDGATLQSGDRLSGGAGYDQLLIEEGGIAPYTADSGDNRVFPTLRGIEYIRNEAVKSILDFRNSRGVEEVETLFGSGSGTTHQYYRNASVETKFTVNGSNWNEATVSAWFAQGSVKAGDTLHLELKDVEGYQVFYFGPDTSWNAEANVHVMLNNQFAKLNLNNDFNKITMEGSGDLRYITFNKQFNEFDATAVDGSITIQRGGDPSAVNLERDAKISTGNGDDSLNFKDSTGNLTIDAGAGANKIIGGKGHDILIGGADSSTMTGNEGEDTFVIAIKPLDSDSAIDVITDFDAAHDKLRFGEIEVAGDGLMISADSYDNFENLVAATVDALSDEEFVFAAGVLEGKTYVFYNFGSDEVVLSVVQLSGVHNLFVDPV